MEIDTLGASLLLGDAGRDVLLWGAWQTGDWGRLDHSAWAGIIEAGWRLGGAGEPEIRFGVARASGDEPDGGHEAFFNLLPTNHKWYGAMDYNAFSNLLDVLRHLPALPGNPLPLRLHLRHRTGQRHRRLGGRQRP